MENEELFAGEPAVDAQQRAQRTHALTKNAPLHVHTEPLLAADEDDDSRDGQWLRDDDQSSEIETRPRWRRAHVSDDDR